MTIRIGLTYTSKSEMDEHLGPCARDEDDLEEYDSEDTIASIVQALRSVHDCEVLRYGWGRVLLDIMLYNGAPAMMFNIAEGYGGRAREAQVPALLDMLGVPYVGSDALALALSLDKAASRAVFRDAGVLVPSGLTVREGEAAKGASLPPYPLIVKPTREGSSRGITRASVVHDWTSLDREVQRIHEVYKQDALVEQFVEGREITVGLVGDPLYVWGIMEIVPTAPDPHWVYGLEAKRNWRQSVTYHAPAALTYEEERQVKLAAIRCARSLGCRDMARVDMRLTADGSPVVLEINPLPGLNPESSDLCLMGKAMGKSYDMLIAAILEGALARVMLGG